MTNKPEKRPEACPRPGREEATPALRVPPMALRAALLLALLVIVALRIRGFVPKDPPPSASPQGFSVDRAAAHVTRLAASPRPPGTSGHDDARDFIRGELARLGISVEIQRATALGTHWGVPYDVARVENLVARLPGRERGPALALVAHYDSVPNAPGAADDASGVAVLLETARALREGPALRNDVIFLFTDAEEAGVLGGNVFVQEHPSFRDIGLVLNFDARGTRGPVGLIETSAGAGALVRHFADAVPDPVASSLFPEISRRLGHQTDFFPFREARVLGMNFAFADGATHYHAPVDDPAHLDRRTLAHAGTLALALARRFGDIDLTTLGAEPVVYFDVPGLGLVVYGRAWALPIAMIPAALFVLALVFAIRRGQARPARVLAGLGALLGSLVVAAALTVGIVAALRALAPAWGVFRGDPFDPGLARIAFALLGATVYAAAYRFFRARLSPFELALGAAAAWLLLALATAALLPGASFLFALPLAASLAGLLVWQRRPSPQSPSSGLWLLLSALPALVLVVPVPYLLFIALGLPRAAPAVAVVVLLAGLIAPLFEVLGAGASRKPALGLTGVCVVLLGLAVATNPFSPAQPRPACLAYALDADRREAAWTTTDQKPAPWTALHIPEATRRAPRFSFHGQGTLRHEAEAPPLDVLPPQLESLGDTLHDGIRTLRFRLRSGRSAPFVLVSVTSEAPIRGGTIDGRRVDEPSEFRPTTDEPWGFTFQGLPAEGIEWSIDITPGAPVSVRVVDRTYALPEQLLRAPMPADLMPMPFRIAGSTFVAVERRFGAGP
ncbi:M20/M25/M40 family metallo-hydrolase [Polyangium sp. y55x31]|uniref:M20/M25/M40 family metallo-hydrolase n=1 Tax=Polyangium sp. y55x31 TaxID=3042688 RepID=UPI002482B20A|nr:M20/M25/M40 family metallo-hydrolase [Polyangium sp. y55x31]MDI1484091.1 M20/M25/M40 family metallo-hydrolase [Polyangium sp. y55x31]